MGIYRCNQCGHIAEHHYQADMGKVPCAQCQNPVTVYDTVYFIRQVLERYIRQARELRAIRDELAQEDSAPEATDNRTDDDDGDNKNILSSVDIHNTDALCNAAQHEPLRQWFAQRNVNARFDFNAVNTSGYFDEAALALGNDYQRNKELLNRVGYAYRHSHTGVNFDLSKKSQKDAQAINNLCRELYSQTLFSRYHYQKSGKIIHLNLQPATAIRQFFTGHWVEWYALSTLLIAAKKKSHDFAFSCARNVQIQFENEDKFELDVVLMPVPGVPVVVECKSGEFRHEIDKYVRLRRRLLMPAQSFILVVAGLDNAQATSLSSMYELNFIPLEQFPCHAEQLIAQANHL